MQKTQKVIPESIRQTALAAVPLLIVIILFALVGKFGVSKVQSVQSEIKTAQKTEKTLTEKLSLLKNLSGVISKTGMANSALPSSNPSITLMGQLKNEAIMNTVILSGIKSNASADPSGLSAASVSFTVAGTRNQIFSFLNGLTKIAPITTINTIQITEQGGGTEAEISLRSYWADLPKTIPSVTTPIEDLTADEKRLLSEVSNLIQPSFSQIELSPSLTDINPNPFGQ